MKKIVATNTRLFSPKKDRIRYDPFIRRSVKNNLIAVVKFEEGIIEWANYYKDIGYPIEYSEVGL